MEWVASIPVWLLCIVIFFLRICDVTLGTVRTVSIVKGYLTLAASDPRVCVVDARPPVADVQAELRRAIEVVLGEAAP